MFIFLFLFFLILSMYFQVVLHAKGEWLEDIKHGDSSSASFMACVEECISERQSRRIEEGLSTKV